ncbi:MAG: hypothetical protein Q7R53_00330 [bacterium]|nr:hypothetical protein [bacterium]
MLVKEGETRRQSTHVADILDIAEQQFFLFMKRRVTIEHEPKTFSDTDSDKSTIPDFRITKKNGEIVYVEITTKARGTGKDPKEKQRKIMEKTGRRYKVLYRESLESIQKRHPGVQFFNGKKIRK